MKISKTQFINYMRCDRYVALEEIYRDRQDAVVSFTDDLELEDLMSQENRSKIQMLVDNMYDEDSEEDLIKTDDPQLEMMMPYYEMLEMISGRAINERFGGNVIYDMNTFNQKRFSYLYEGFELFCFLDGYQEDDDTIRVFETKATTSNKYSFDKFNFKLNGEKHAMFTELPSSIFVPTDQIIKDLPSDYYKKEAKLFDRLNDLGKYIYDLAYQRFVYEKNNEVSNKKREYYLIILNHEYVHDGKVDENNRPIYSNDVVRFYNLTSLVEKMENILEEDLKTIIDRLNSMDARPVALGKHCARGKRNQCPFFDICHSDIPKENSMFIYMDRHHGFKNEDNERLEFYDLLNSGTVSAFDIPKEYLNRVNNQIQRQVIESGKPYYNYDKIRDGIKQIKYPIYHLDFESFNAPLPRYKGEVPYRQSLFQYSIHIERSPGVCDKERDHYEYLASDHSDHRKRLVESMLDVIKDDGGSVLVYNVGFERGRLKELQTYFPEYHEQIENIIDRLFDLMHIVKNNTKLYEILGYEKEEAKTINFYHNDLQGSFSIKYVLPIFSKLSYKGMNVANGTDAMIAYNKFPSLNEREFKQTYNDLVEYCKQDTWAMFEILEGLRKI